MRRLHRKDVQALATTAKAEIKSRALTEDAAKTMVGDLFGAEERKHLTTDKAENFLTLRLGVGAAQPVALEQPLQELP